MIRLAVVVILALACAPRSAAAQHEVEPLPDRRFVVDGGAIAFVWLPLVAGAAIELYVEPREQPLLFDDDEGGEPSRIGAETPQWALTTGSLALGLVIAGAGDESRWFHLKGFVQSIAMTGLATKVLKNTFGRHRPDRDAAADSADGRRSFVSGHSSRSAAALTYTALYLHEHVLGGEVWVGWEVALYAAMAAAEVAISAERVHNHRHHVGDTVGGALVGAAMSAGFFAWQERRYRRAEASLEVEVGAGGIVASVGWAL